MPRVGFLIAGRRPVASRSRARRGPLPMSINACPRRQSVALEDPRQVVAAGGRIWFASRILIGRAKSVVIVVRAPVQTHRAVLCETWYSYRIEPVRAGVSCAPRSR